MKAFHAYDIRGIYNKDFNKTDAYKIGFFLPRLLNTKQILVGHDVRISSPEIFEYLSKGITDAGADVLYAGKSTTPMIYFSTAHYKLNASVMITASHNGKEYNGMKISKENALPVGYDTGLKSLEDLVLNEEIHISEKKGNIINMDVKNEYISFLKKYTADFSNLKIVADCSNGMAGLLIHHFLKENTIFIYDELDGTFPNHEANPLVQENVADLKKKVIEENADVGIIFDGDADRVMFVDEKGNFVSPDLMIALFGHYFFEKKKLKGKVLQDIRTSKAVGEYLQQFGSDNQMHMWRVGRAFAAHKLREIDGLFGGELAGHYYFKDFFYSDSGILAALIALETIADFKKKGISFSEMVNKVKTYANSGEINFKLENKKAAMDAVKEICTKDEKPVAFYDFDGYRVEFKDWWFNIRPSNTEPYLRLILEARTEILLNQKLDLIKATISNFD